MLPIPDAGHDWHDFDLAAATAAATLVGLLFVAVTLNGERILGDDRPHLRAIAEQAFQNYMMVLVTSLLLLLPRQSMGAQGIELLTAGIAACIWALYRVRGVWRVSDAQFDRVRTWRRLLPSLAGASILAYSGWDLRRGDEDGMLLFAAAAVLLIAAATATSWDLLVRIASSRRA